MYRQAPPDPRVLAEGERIDAIDRVLNAAAIASSSLETLIERAKGPRELVPREPLRDATVDASRKLGELVRALEDFGELPPTRFSWVAAAGDEALIASAGQTVDRIGELIASMRRERERVVAVIAALRLDGAS